MGLRLPGQYFDGETGLHYNYFRDYDPSLGRYIESDPIGLIGGVSLYVYVGSDPAGFVDPFGLYKALVVQMPDGSEYMPTTTVKNADQADSYGQPEGTDVPIAVPDNVDPQSVVIQGAMTGMFTGPTGFLWYWRPGGPHDYKLKDPKFDAFGNFGYGASGAAAGYPCDFLVGIGDLAHGGKNNPINTGDIAAGYHAIASGGTLRTKEYEP